MNRCHCGHLTTAILHCPSCKAMARKHIPLRQPPRSDRPKVRRIPPTPAEKEAAAHAHRKQVAERLIAIATKRAQAAQKRQSC